MKQEMNINCKKFWNYNINLKKYNGLPEFIFLGNKIANEGPDICNLLSSHFSSVYGDQFPPHFPISFYDEDMVIVPLLLLL